jgi:hypothetical protein
MPSQNTFSYIGNSKSLIAHAKDCHYINLMTNEHKRGLEDITGYRPCSKCNPNPDQTLFNDLEEVELHVS